MKILTYNEFVEQLKEGLIITHDIYKYESSLKHKLYLYKIENKIEIKNKFAFDLTIYNAFDYLDTIKMVANDICGLYGFYPSYFYSKNSFGEKGFKWSELNEKNVNENTIEVKILFEAKYDDNLYTNNIDCPDKLYHFTQVNISDIMEKGIYPKSKNRNTDHPARIYLFHNIDDSDGLLLSLKRSDIINSFDLDKSDIKRYLLLRKYSLLEIDCSRNKLVLHSDPNYENKGYFTYDNITPTDIKVLKTNQ